VLDLESGGGRAYRRIGDGEACPSLPQAASFPAGRRNMLEQGWLGWICAGDDRIYGIERGRFSAGRIRNWRNEQNSFAGDDGKSRSEHRIGKSRE
jgi:hypothetical protein